MTLVGITGGIGSGKSTVLAIFQHLGARILDADMVVHELYEPGNPGYCLVLERWGSELLLPDGRLDRAAIARRVFHSRSEREWLESVIHPLVKIRFDQAVATGSGDLFGAVPLLFETGWNSICRVTIAVWCDPEQQRQRLQQRGWIPAEIDRRNAAQLSMNEKLRRANFGIINTGTRELLEYQCTQLWHNQLTAKTETFKDKSHDRK